MTNLVRSNFQDHPFHLVSPSPWPLYTSISLFTLTVNAALSMHLFSNSYIFFYLALATVTASMTLWFRDIISEGTFLGNHTLAVQKGLNLGVILFIVSEACFFVAIFWAFFHSALTPTVELGAQWPPLLGIFVCVALISVKSKYGSCSGSCTGLININDNLIYNIFHYII